MTAADVRKRLAKACNEAGSQRMFADRHGLPHGRISEVLNGVREPPESVCTALGLERIVSYRKAKP